MRIISRRRLREFWEEHPRSQTGLEHWFQIASHAEWFDFSDIRATFNSADVVSARSGRLLYVFNICGNLYRLIAAVHFNTKTLYVRSILTHEDYDRGRWKDD